MEVHEPKKFDAEIIEKFESDFISFLGHLEWLAVIRLGALTENPNKKISGRKHKLLPAYRVIESQITVEEGIITNTAPAPTIKIITNTANNFITMIYYFKKLMDHITNKIDSRLQRVFFKPTLHDIPVNPEEVTTTLIIKNESIIREVKKRTSYDEYLESDFGVCLALSRLGLWTKYIRCVEFENDSLLYDKVPSSIWLNPTILIHLLMLIALRIFAKTQNNREVISLSKKITKNLSSAIEINSRHYSKVKLVEEYEEGDSLTEFIDKRIEEVIQEKLPDDKEKQKQIQQNFVLNEIRKFCHLYQK